MSVYISQPTRPSDLSFRLKAGIQEILTLLP